MPVDLYLLLGVSLPYYLANITRYLAIHPTPISNNVILVLKAINLDRDKGKVVKEFKLYGKE
jgi:hypothetical protein